MTEKENFSRLGQDAEGSDYALAMRAASREARWGFALSGAIALFFWGAIALLKTEGSVLGLPLWFWWAVMGSYALSIVAVFWFNRIHSEDPHFDRAVEAIKKEAP